MMAKADAAVEEKPATKRRGKKPGPKRGAKAKAAREAAKTNNGEAPPPAPVNSFKFELNALVTITQSREQGVVRARSEWATGNVSYFIAYTSKSGEFKEAWIDEDLLSAFVERRKRAK